MSRDDAVLSAYERLVEALAADLLDADEDEVLATHTPAAARVVADALRQHLRRASGEAAPPPSSDGPPGASPASSLSPSSDLAGRPEKKP